ncbi:iduronate-2-sulfatase [Saccharobesus litoralis]|uniref:Iduronate-2-sulfatase n=1 Tax=Saccharobesus litoralis TaxID=2172099 RepID=A0A2S0VML1_9ALTE|nr:sulfatase [Saccharobesus litoralis]AWB65453.1 iduronate-2-sulfatase [Saccharobesus litoralis]
MNKNIKRLLGATLVNTLALSSLFMCSSTLAANDKDKLNVLMIAIDDMNNWPTSWGGKAITPNIDRLAAEGVQFANAHAAVPACNPSRVAILTGLRPEVTGQYTNKGNFRKLKNNKDLVTLPQLMRKNGYEAVAAGKIFHHPHGMGAKANPMSDPISWDYQGRTRTGAAGHKMFLDKNNHAAWLNGASEFNGLPITDYIRKFGVWGVSNETTEQTGDWQTAEYCADYMKKASDKPFFLACGISRPHSPQIAPKKYFDLYPIDEIELPTFFASDMDDIAQQGKTNFSSGFAQKVMSDKDEWKRAVQGYLASVSFADAVIGRMLKGLEESPHKDNTLVVLWSDHGFHLGTKQRWEKFSLWNDATHSPFIIKMPNGKASKITKPVSLIDIYPTLVDVLQLENAPKLSGNSLTPLMTNPHINWDKPAIITYNKGNSSIRLDNWNYIRRSRGQEELYDLATDPNEYTNLAEQKKYKDVIKRLKAYLPHE